MSDDRDIGEQHEDSLLVAEYALGLLPAADQASVAARLKAEPQLRAELALWQLRLADLDSEFAESAAPSGALQRLERRLFADTARSARWWDSLMLWRGLAGAAALVAVVAVGVNIATPRPSPQAFAAELVAALQQQGSDVSFVALYNQSTGQLRLTALSGSTVPDKDYELWAIEGDQPAKSMGVVPVNQRVDVKIAPEILQGFGEGTVLAVTLEQRGGSPTGVAQGPIVAKGVATPV